MTSVAGFEMNDLGGDVARMEAILTRLGIQARVEESIRGPRITTYRVAPGMGTRLKKLTAATDDVALHFQASGCRAIPVPEQGRIELEVSRPANDWDRVDLYDDGLSSDEYAEAVANRSKLPLVVGQDVQGRAVIHDLSDAPHLLVAGTTGSGKSVFLRGVINSLLAGPEKDRTKLLLIDPKRLDFAEFDGGESLLTPVLNNVDDAIIALGMLVSEMEARYKRMAAEGVRSIDELEGEDMGRIVCIIDEFADIIAEGGKQVEESVQLLAQKARACGIHLIVATQQPRVQVITGGIKANIPSRVAFRVASKTDSRVIMDRNGAEDLVGSGDGLVTFGGGTPLRFQGAV